MNYLNIMSQKETAAKKKLSDVIEGLLERVEYAENQLRVSFII